jgi:hypothetical protein
MRDYSDIRKDEGGHIVVETIGAFVPFLLLVVSILSLVNIVAVQARIHYALTQTAGALSMYCYALEATGVAHELTLIEGQAETVKKGVDDMKQDIGEVLRGIEDLSDIAGAASAGERVVTRAAGWAGSALEDPEEALKLLLSYTIDHFVGVAFEQLARPMVGRYLANGDMSGDEYLTRMGVVDSKTGAVGLQALDFNNTGGIGARASALVDRNGNVRLTVRYEIEYTFGGLPLPFSPTLKITQTALTKAWLNGSGEGYW